MSKDFLLEQIKALVPNEYSIELYFLKIDKRNQNPYFVFKHTFKNSNYLPDYINALRDTIIKYQIQPIEYVQKYDGQNSKTSCDKLSVNSQLISEQWNHLFSSVAGAPREQITGKYQGYLLNCQPQKDGLPSITIVKTGNPLISLAKKDSKVFRHTTASTSRRSLRHRSKKSRNATRHSLRCWVNRSGDWCFRSSTRKTALRRIHLSTALSPDLSWHGSFPQN